jgi:hypothetical protein
MKQVFILAFSLLCLFAYYAEANQTLTLPKVEATAGMDILQAMERRVAARHFSNRTVSLENIATILWAGNGLILKEGKKTIHGYDTVSGATGINRYTIPWGWSKPYLKVYLLIEKGAFEYMPVKHQLKCLAERNLIEASGSNSFGAHGVIVIAADYDAMPDGKTTISRDVAFLSAGSAAQNMVLAGSVFGIQMLTQVAFGAEEIRQQLNLSGNIEPLTILSFGYSE